jgi:hypothetical protein
MRATWQCSRLSVELMKPRARECCGGRRRNRPPQCRPPKMTANPGRCGVGAAAARAVELAGLGRLDRWDRAPRRGDRAPRFRACFHCSGVSTWRSPSSIRALAFSSSARACATRSICGRTLASSGLAASMQRIESRLLLFQRGVKVDQPQPVLLEYLVHFLLLIAGQVQSAWPDSGLSHHFPAGPGIIMPRPGPWPG